MSDRQEVSIGGRVLSLSNLEKVMYPSTGFTKAQLIDYYVRVGPVMLPHLTNRPITLKRYPDGVDKQSFFMKNCPDYRPEWLSVIPMITSSGDAGTTDFCKLDELAALAWVANLAAIELHPGLQLNSNLEQPTCVVFDLDPGPPATIVQCSKVGLRLRDLLAEHNLKSFPKTSGSKGLQIYVPVNTPVTFKDTSAFALALGQIMEKETPDQVVTKMARDLRHGKVLIDWSQNSRFKTTVAVYSLRARECPTVSTPITWEEVEMTASGGDSRLLIFEYENVFQRVETLGDLFGPVLDMKQKLPAL